MILDRVVGGLASVATIALTLFIEAAPFVLLGSMLGAILETSGMIRRLSARVPRSKAGGIALGIAAGLVLPTCECGSVPLARRLLRGGLPPHVALPFMLAAPVVNPAVIASTLVAFRGDLRMLFGRLAMVILPAVLVGLGVARSPASEVVRRIEPERPAGDPHDHGGSSVGEVLRHTATDFLDMSRFLLLGGVVSGLFRVLVPAETIRALGGGVVPSIAVMMGLAVLLCVCSEADAFVAASFAVFPPAARLAFVAIGPLVDLKLLLSYGATFRPRVATRIVFTSTLAVLGTAIATGLLLNKGGG